MTKYLNEYNSEEDNEDQLFTNIEEQMKDKVLYIPSEINFDLPLLTKASNNLSEELDKFALQNKTIDLSYLEMIIYSISAYTKMAALVIFNVHILILYENLGSNLLVLSFFVALTRAIEIILKPSIAIVSDKSTSKYGRRKPFLYFGCLFYVTFLILLFFPPIEIESNNKSNNTFIRYFSKTNYVSFWFGCFYLLFFCFDTICFIPYSALAPELSTNPKKREQLYFFNYISQYLGILTAVTGPVLLQYFYFNSCDTSICNQNSNSLYLYKKCVNSEENICSILNNMHSLRIVSYVICFVFLIGVILLGIFVKERNSIDYKKIEMQDGITLKDKRIEFKENKEIKHKLDNKLEIYKSQNANKYLISSVVGIFKNKPFVSLIPPYLIDNIILSVFSTMLPFYLKYVIDPEDYCLKNNIEMSSIFCDSNLLMGICMVVFFVSCLLNMALWHLLVKQYGKKNCWKFSSLLGVILFLLFLFCNIKHPIILILCSSLSSLVAAGAYLNDVFMSDIIDYDELITGSRNEGIYTVFATFIPKLVSIFSQAIPLAILVLLGFVNTINDNNSSINSNSSIGSKDNKTNDYNASDLINYQPIQVTIFIRMFFSVLPSGLSLLSYFYKKKYLINKDEQVNKVRKTIKAKKIAISTNKKISTKYNINEQYPLISFKDPIMKNRIISINKFKNTHFETQAIIDHFPSYEDLKLIYKKDYIKIKKATKILLFLSYSMIIVSLILLIFSFNLLENEIFSLVPLLLLFILSGSIIASIYNQMKYNMISQVIRNDKHIDSNYVKLHYYKYLKENTKDDNTFNNLKKKELLNLSNDVIETKEN